MEYHFVSFSFPLRRLRIDYRSVGGGGVYGGMAVAVGWGVGCLFYEPL